MEVSHLPHLVKQRGFFDTFLEAKENSALPKSECDDRL